MLTSILAHGGSGLAGDGIPGVALYVAVVVGAVLGLVALRARGPETIGGEIVAPLSVDGAEADAWPGDGASTPFRLGGQIIGLGVLALVLALSWTGSHITGLNPLPLLVGSIVWWAVPAATLLLGDWWRWIDPFDALASVIERVRGRSTESDEADDPGHVGTDEAGDWWVPALLLASFAWVLTCWSEGLKPRSLGLWVTGLTVVMVGGAVFGGRAWVRRCSPYAVVCGTIAAAAPIGWDRGRIRFRAPWRGMARRAGGRRSQGVVLVLLGATVWEAVAGSQWWADVAGDGGATARTLWSTLGFAWCTVIVTAVWTGPWVLVERIARRSGTAVPEPLAPDLVPALAPLVAVAPLAHQLAPLLIDGQNLWALASDPFAQGWDLFGSTSHDTVEEPLSLGLQAWIQLGLVALGLGLGLVGMWDRLVARVGALSLTVGWAAAGWAAGSGIVVLWLLLGA